MLFYPGKFLVVLVLLLLGLVSGFAWQLTRNPSLSELAETRAQALTFLLRSMDEDGHFLYRFHRDGSPLPVSREEQFEGELAAAITLAREARKNKTLLPAHEKNLSIILEDWFSESGGRGYLSNSRELRMEWSGRALALLSESPYLEERRAYAEALLKPIEEWALMGPSAEFQSNDVRQYWKGASTTPAESIGATILGVGNLYLRTGDERHKQAFSKLSERYRLLIDSPVRRLAVEEMLYQVLKLEDDRRALFLAANTSLSSQKKNFLSAEYGFFTDTNGNSYSLIEQAGVVAGLFKASSVAKALEEEEMEIAYREASLRGAGALLRAQVGKAGKLSGGFILKETPIVDTRATALVLDALQEIGN